MYFGESILAKSIFGHFFCPFLKIPKNFPGKKLDIFCSLSPQNIIYIFRQMGGQIYTT
jgi:hypothetical protein